jgi:hypothetical protein
VDDAQPPRADGCDDVGDARRDHRAAARSAPAPTCRGRPARRSRPSHRRSAPRAR